MRSIVSFFRVTAISLIALLVLAPPALAAEMKAAAEDALGADASAPKPEESVEPAPAAEDPSAADAETEAEAAAAEELAPAVAPDVAPTPRSEVSPFERIVDGAAIGFDVLIVRPLSFAAVVVGAPMFLIAAPFAAIDGQLGATYDVFLQVPIDYAVWRPAGDL